MSSQETEKDRLTSREKERVLKKKVLESEAFDKWYEARRAIQPTPSNPYQAYMIDRNLRAKPYTEESWGDYVNRSDLEGVDNPQGVSMGRAPIQRTHRSPTFVPASKVRPQHEHEPLFQEAVSMREDFKKTYGINDVDIVVEKRGTGNGLAYGRPMRPQDKGVVLIPEELYDEVVKDPKKYKTSQFRVGITHELGHASHLGQSYPVFGEKWITDPDRSTIPHSPELKAIFETTKDSPTKKIREERMAHAVTRDFYGKKGWKLKGSAKLMDDFALGTYESKTPKSMQKFDTQTLQPKSPRFVFNRGTGLIETAKKAKKLGLRI